MSLLTRLREPTLKIQPGAAGLVAEVRKALNDAAERPAFRRTCIDSDTGSSATSSGRPGLQTASLGVRASGLAAAAIGRGGPVPRARRTILIASLRTRHL